MKNLLFKGLMISFVLFAISCGKTDTNSNSSEKKMSDTPVNKENGSGVYKIDPSTIKIEWTAFKTTDKLPVKGTFLNIGKKDLTKIPVSSKKEHALDNVNFSLSINDLSTANDVRDLIIKKLFFGIMKETKELVGSIQVDKQFSNKGSMALRMNDVVYKFPITIKYEGDIASIHGEMDLNKWNTTDAQLSLHKNCEDKHKGADGKSRTWSVVEIDGSVKILNK